MRERKIKVQTSKEEIVSYEHHILAKLVRVHIAIGDADAEGRFVEITGQSYEPVDIRDNRYQELMAEVKKDGKVVKPAGVFRKDDLWAQIDKLRHARKLMLELNGQQV